MFAVYRTDSDGYTYSADTVLFVTACEQTAKDAVTLAELELEQALAVPYPNWTRVREKGAGYYYGLVEAYQEKLASIFTVDRIVAGETGYSVDKETSYYYEKVPVR